MATTKKKRNIWNLLDCLEGDKVVWIIAVMLILISIACIFSSTSRLLKEGQTRIDIVKDQLVTVGMGVFAILACYNIKKIKIFRFFSKFGFIISFILLGLVLSKIDTDFIKSLEINGARRILQIGNYQMHVNEVVKVAMVCYFAWVMDAYRLKELKGPKEDKWIKILYIYLPFVASFLMTIPGSNSAALFIGFLMFVTILLGGGSFKDMALLGAVGLAAVLLCFGCYKLSDGKVFQRIGTGISRIFDNKDWHAQVINSRVGSKDYYDAVDEIRQPEGAKQAIREGGLLGKGPGQSTQRYAVPDMSEDYMFSFILEEYGIWGGIIVLTLYISLLARSSIIVRNCGKDLYAKLTVAGLSLLITGQAFIHITVNADLGPMTGQTLPLISHGNFAFLCFSIAFGLILSISRIASKKIEEEEKAADALVESHDVINDLDIIDDEI